MCYYYCWKTPWQPFLLAVAYSLTCAAASLAEMIVAVWAWAIEKSAPQTLGAVGTLWKGLQTAQNRSARRLVVDYFVRIELLMRMPNLFLELLNFGDEALPF